MTVLFVLVVVVAVLLVGTLALLAGNSAKAPPVDGGQVSAGRVPESRIAMRELRRQIGEGQLGTGGETQILFGDLHVHTTFSGDALAYSMPLFQNPGARPPADACDFARYCSQLDFWSINDHAEQLGPEEWRATREAIESCNAVAGDAERPDIVAFLGWEWSQGASTPEEHYGHKNVVLRQWSGRGVPARPISARRNPVHTIIATLASFGAWEDWQPWAEVHRRLLDDLFFAEICPAGVYSPALPPSCHEIAPTPDLLFEKLDQWDVDALVIPHGLAWGITNPPEMDLRHQIVPPMHDPKYQRLIEVYSGHGASEVYVGFARASLDGEGRGICPAPTEVFEPCCHRAGELARVRCQQPDSVACDAEVAAAREGVARASVSLLGRMLGSPADEVPGTTQADFGDCGQLREAFLPAYDYRPRGSAQYGLALGDFSKGSTPQRWRTGFLAASDNHSARPGTGYKEFGRTEMTEGLSWSEQESPRSSYFVTGGLTAVHSPGRDRDSIFRALQRREVYGTSGDRILLHFDEIAPDGSRIPMGSEVESSEVPRFEVRALGAFEQKPGCPDFVTEGLGEERLEWLCLNECFHPSDRRKTITRIEVVRIRPQISPEEDVAERIEDPWRSFACPAGPAGCVISFDDPEYAAAGRETLYYVRAIQAPSPAVNGAGLPCEERAADGRCLRAQPCQGTGLAGGGPALDCLAAVPERAWSSPIWRRPG
ncbi:MAG: DUF3604 domain-containing protein [Deltaproteobacteria bacterium]